MSPQNQADDTLPTIAGGLAALMMVTFWLSPTAFKLRLGAAGLAIAMGGSLVASVFATLRSSRWWLIVTALVVFTIIRLFTRGLAE